MRVKMEGGVTRFNGFFLSGRPARRLLPSLLLLSLLATGACRRGPAASPPAPPPSLLFLQEGDAALESGDHRAAARSYERYLSHSTDDDTRRDVALRLGLLYLVPGGTAENSERGRELLEEFVRQPDESGLHRQALLLLRIEEAHRLSLSRVEKLEAAVSESRRRGRRLEDEVQRLEFELERLEQEKELIESHLEIRSQRIEALSRELEEERRRRSQLAQELEKLKEIDLQRRRPPRR